MNTDSKNQDKPLKIEKDNRNYPLHFFATGLLRQPQGIFLTMHEKSCRLVFLFRNIKFMRFKLITSQPQVYLYSGVSFFYVSMFDLPAQ